MSLCIITNDSALFSFSSSESLRHLRSMSLGANLVSIRQPTQADFERVFCKLEHEFNAALVLCPPEELLPGEQAARCAAQAHGGMLHISVMNTGQIGAGLGILAQMAARHAANGACLHEVEDQVRATLPGLFTVFCPERIPQETANPGDSGGQPLYTLENGSLIPYKKLRTRRHLAEDFLEFMEEFEMPQQLVFFHGKNKPRLQNLLENAQRLFPAAQVNDLTLNLPLSCLFGGLTTGLTIFEMPGKNLN